MSSAHSTKDEVVLVTVPGNGPVRKLHASYDQHHMQDLCDVIGFTHRLKEIRDEAEADEDAKGLATLLGGLTIFADAYVRVRVERLTELMDMDYQEYLSTPEWQRTRKDAVERAENRCQLCNSAGPLNVHHNTYERRGFEADKDLLVLCRSCHALHHGKAE